MSKNKNKSSKSKARTYPAARRQPKFVFSAADGDSDSSDDDDDTGYVLFNDVPDDITSLAALKQWYEQGGYKNKVPPHKSTGKSSSSSFSSSSSSSSPRAHMRRQGSSSSPGRSSPHFVLHDEIVKVWENPGVGTAWLKTKGWLGQVVDINDHTGDIWVRPITSYDAADWFSPHMKPTRENYAHGLLLTRRDVVTPVEKEKDFEQIKEAARKREATKREREEEEKKNKDKPSAVTYIVPERPGCPVCKTLPLSAPVYRFNAYTSHEFKMAPMGPMWRCSDCGVILEQTSSGTVLSAPSVKIVREPTKTPKGRPQNIISSPDW